MTGNFYKQEHKQGRTTIDNHYKQREMKKRDMENKRKQFEIITFQAISVAKNPDFDTMTPLK